MQVYLWLWLVCVHYIRIAPKLDSKFVDSTSICRYATKISIHQYDIFAVFWSLRTTLRLRCRYTQTGYEHIMAKLLQPFGPDFVAYSIFIFIKLIN